MRGSCVADPTRAYWLPCRAHVLPRGAPDVRRTNDLLRQLCGRGGRAHEVLRGDGFLRRDR